MQEHRWRKQIDGELRYFLAQYHAGDWNISSRPSSESHWTAHDQIARKEWESLREVLWNKYQRRRCPWKLIEKIDSIIEKLPAEDETATPKNQDDWAALDHQHCWHPFTDQVEWESREPLIITSGNRCWLTDSSGNRYLDGNSSIWTNIHGHNHPALNEALTKQSQEIAHSSYLGFGNPRASELAKALSDLFPEGELNRVFFSDNGSTAIEVALKMSLQYRKIKRQTKRKKIIAFSEAYHGDTLGAASVGAIENFTPNSRYGYDVIYLQNNEELEELDPSQITAVILEPLVQGVNEIHLWLEGMLKELRTWCNAHNVHLILDEVLTGFGRTGEMFACQHEDVIPDFLCLAKGLTGGYMPLAATLIQEEIYETFKNIPTSIFYYGHSYTANQLGCALSLASLKLFEKEKTLEKVQKRSLELMAHLVDLKSKHQHILETRQIGLISGISLANPGGIPFPAELNIGAKVCLAARKYGLLTRPINDTIVIIPPLSIVKSELTKMINALSQAIYDVTEEL